MNLFDNNSSYWNTIDNTGKYLNSSGILTTFTVSNDGGSYSDSNIYWLNATYRGKGMYVGARYSGTTQSMISTTYNTSLSCSGEYIDVYLNTGKFIRLKSFYMFGNSSANWDDFPYKIIILGSNDGTVWNLIKNANDLNVNTIVTINGNTFNSDILRNVIAVNGYKDGVGNPITSVSLNYNVNAIVSYNRIRFVITDLIRGRVLSLQTFNMFFDIY